MKSLSRHRTLAATALILLAASSVATSADARRGGSFGSRGSRTYAAPRTAYGSRYVPPVERSMTQRSPYQQSPGYAQGSASQSSFRPAASRFGGFGGGLLTGIVAGGLIGHFLGHGAGYGWSGGGGGAGGGLLASLIQIAILGGIVWLAIGFFRRRSGFQGSAMPNDYGQTTNFGAQSAGPWGGSAAQTQDYASPSEDIAITSADQQAFEQLLIGVQDAFGREDYSRLRALTTPEIMSYLSEELSQNATRGVRNAVSETRLIDAEISEAWREPSGDYATIIMRYESIDVMRDRASGTIVSGSAHLPTETVELWTFVRTAGQPWKLSSIQDG